MKKIFTLFSSTLIALHLFALDPNHFTITRITAPYFVVDGNAPATINKAYVGFEVKNNSNSAVTYSGLKFTITSIGTSVSGQNYSIAAPVSGITNIGTLAPGESRICYYYIGYPAHVSAQATVNISLTDATASSKTQSFNIYNRSCISANAGGTATQTFTNQDLIGGLIYDDVTYAVGNVKNGDETDFQVAVSTQFDPTKITLLGTEVTASSVPGIPVGATDSLYFITGLGSNGATITIRWTFRISGFNFTNYLLPCAGATSGSTNYKYALNTSLGQGSPVVVSAAANPLTITKTSDKTIYGINSPAVFTITITNPSLLYGVTIDKITDEIPTGFTFQSMHASSQVTSSNSTTIPAVGATGAISFDGGVVAAGTPSYYIAPNSSVIVKYTATSPGYSTAALVTTARDYVSATEVGTANNTVYVSATLPVTLVSFNGSWVNNTVKLNWKAAAALNGHHFEIERSADGAAYQSIGREMVINSSNEQSYSFTDLLPGNSNEYRLKMVDIDGQYKYSPVIALNKKQTGFNLQKVYPVPFINELNIQLLSDKKQLLQLELTDMLGRTVYTRSENCVNGANTIILDNMDRLSPGIYLLKLRGADESLEQKLIKL